MTIIDPDAFLFNMTQKYYYNNGKNLPSSDGFRIIYDESGFGIEGRILNAPNKGICYLFLPRVGYDHK